MYCFFSRLKHFGAGQGRRGEDKGIEGSAVFQGEEWVNFSDYFFFLKNSSFEIFGVWLIPPVLKDRERPSEGRLLSDSLKRKVKEKKGIHLC